MKKFFTFIASAVLVVLCVFVVSIYGTKTVVSIEKTGSSGLYDIYTVQYNNGDKDILQVKNGEDGEDIKLQDLYTAVKLENGYGDEYTITEFVEDYLSMNASQVNDLMYMYKAKLGAVSVYGEFKTTAKGIQVNGGAGVIYRPHGYTGDDYFIITNYHVIYHSSSVQPDKIATTIKVYLFGTQPNVSYALSNDGGNIYDSQGYPTVKYSDGSIDCEYVGGSLTNDIAVLRVKDPSLISSKDARCVEVASSDYVMAGETTYAIGFPKSLGISVTKGIVSVDSENIEMTAVNGSKLNLRVIRVDCAINQGNSGGGIFNAKGQLIGIINARNTAADDFGYAIPSTIATRLADNIIASASNIVDYATRAEFNLTVKAQNTRAELEESTGHVIIKEDVIVSEVGSNSIFKNYLLKNDKIISIECVGKMNKIDITRSFQVQDFQLLVTKGDIVKITYYRNGTESSVEKIITDSVIVKIN